MSAGTSGDSAPAVEAGWVRVVETGEGKFAQHLLDGRHHLFADERAAVGGGDRGPNPYELLLMALGACTAMTLRLYADRKQWPLVRVSVRLRHAKIHAEDCAECETKQGMLDRIERVIDLEGTLDAAQRQRLLEIANMCPVHRTLTSEISIKSQLGA
jgi:putative redox protein